MNYEKIYENLINRAKSRETTLLVKEVHHVLPKCLGGSDEKHNLVSLSLREHYIAHLLLYKIYLKKTGILFELIGKLACAVFYMKNTRDVKSNKLFTFNSHLYEKARLDALRYISEINSEMQKGEGNSNYGNIWIKNPKTRESKRIKKYEPIPKGWIRGRYTSLSDGHEKRILKMRERREEKYKNTLKHYAFLLRIRKALLTYGWEEAKRMYSISFSKPNMSLLMRRVKKELNNVLLYCKDISREEAILLCENAQGHRVSSPITSTLL